MKKAVQPKTAVNSKFEQFENEAILSLSAQKLVKGGNDDEDTSNIIVEEIIEH